MKEKVLRKDTKGILVAVNMSKEATIKNQNKLKVYLEKIKKNDSKPNSKGNNQIRQRPRTN